MISRWSSFGRTAQHECRGSGAALNRARSFRENRPKDPITVAKAWALRILLYDCELLPQREERLKETTIPLSTGWLLSACTEAQGKQDLWMKQEPEVLEALREQAIVQSGESSNRIEGVTVPAERLRLVVLGQSKPRDRSEEELAGYRKAIDRVFTRKRRVAALDDL